MHDVTHLGTDELIKLLDSVYRHTNEKTVTIGIGDKQLLYDMEAKAFYTATPFNIWDTIDPVKGIKNDLISTEPDFALSANQGRILQEQHDAFYDEYGVFKEHVEEEFLRVDARLDTLDSRADATDQTLIAHAEILADHAQQLEGHDNEIIRLDDKIDDLTTSTRTAIDGLVEADIEHDKQITELHELTAEMGEGKAEKDLTNVENDIFLAKSVASGLIPESQKRKPNGVACLDENGKVHIDELPDAILGQVIYGGLIKDDVGTATVTTHFKTLYNYPNDTIVLNDANAALYEGVYFISTAIGFADSIAYRIGDWLISNGISWNTIGASDAVRTVNGMIGDVNISLLDLDGVSSQGGHILTAHSTHGVAAEDYNTSIHLAANDYSIIAALASSRRGLRLTQGAGSNTINLLLDQTDNHLKFGNGEAIDNYKKVYHEGYKPNSADVSAVSSLRGGNYTGDWNGGFDNRCYVGSVSLGDNKPTNDQWHHLIQSVHRDGLADGPSFVFQLACGMTSNFNELRFRGNKTRAWNTIYHSGNKPSPNEIGAIASHDRIIGNATSNSNYETMLEFKRASDNSSLAHVGGAINFAYLYNGRCNKYIKMCNDGVVRVGANYGYEGDTVLTTGNHYNNKLAQDTDETVSPNSLTVLSNYTSVIAGIGYKTRVRHVLHRGGSGWGHYYIQVGIDDAGNSFRTWTMGSDGSFWAEGNMYAPNYHFTSDINLKKDFEPFEDIDLDAIKLQWYTMKDTGNKQFGIIAQDVLKYAPDLVSGTEWTEDNPTNHYTVANVDLLFLMVAKLRNEIKLLKQWHK